MNYIAPCFQCRALVDIALERCSQCHVSFETPQCTNCGKPVCEPREPRDTFNTPSWNQNWKLICVNCGFNYAACVNHKNGHPDDWSMPAKDDDTRVETTLSPSQAITSSISVTGGESIHVQYDSWDYQPTIRIEVRRKQSGNAGEAAFRLEEEDSIVLTVWEIQEIIAQLNGPLQILLQRLPAWRDTT